MHGGEDDHEAYEVLARKKREGQSFSQMIKEHLGGKHTSRDFLRVVSRLRLADDTLESVERQVTARRKHPIRAPKLFARVPGLRLIDY